MSLREDVSRMHIAIVCIYMVIIPGILLATLSLQAVNRAEVLTAILCGGVAVLIYYLSLWKWETSQIAVGVGIWIMIWVLFTSNIYFNVTEMNVFLYYSPYIEALSAWAVPTIMWQETRLFLLKSKVDDYMSEYAIESIGFLVALIYTLLYVMLDLHARGPEAGLGLFPGLLMIWPPLRLFLDPKHGLIAD